MSVHYRKTLKERLKRKGDNCLADMQDVRALAIIEAIEENTAETKRLRHELRTDLRCHSQQQEDQLKGIIDGLVNINDENNEANQSIINALERLCESKGV